MIITGGREDFSLFSRPKKMTAAILLTEQGTWMDIPDLPGNGRWGHACASIQHPLGEGEDGGPGRGFRVVVAGGSSSDASIYPLEDTVDVLDFLRPAQPWAWRRLSGRMTKPRFGAVMVSLPNPCTGKDRVFILGGRDNEILNSTEEFNTRLETWSSAKPLGIKKMYFAAVAVASNLLHGC